MKLRNMQGMITVSKTVSLMRMHSHREPCVHAQSLWNRLTRRTMMTSLFSKFRKQKSHSFVFTRFLLFFTGVDQIHSPTPFNLCFSSTTMPPLLIPFLSRCMHVHRWAFIYVNLRWTNERKCNICLCTNYFI